MKIKLPVLRCNLQMKRKNISEERVKVDLDDAKRFEVSKATTTIRTVRRRLTRYVIFDETGCGYSWKACLGIKRIVPGVGMESKAHEVALLQCIRKWELVYKKEKIGYSPSTFVRLVLKKNVPTGFDDVFYDNKPLSYWLW